MLYQEIEEHVRKILFDVFEGDQFLKENAASINSDVHLEEVVDFSSLEAVEIIAYIEETFQIEVDDDDLNINFITSITNICKYIEEAISKE